MSGAPDGRTVQAMVDECERRYVQLVKQGVDGTLAMDRVWYAFEAVVEGRETEYAPDRLLYGALREIKERGI